MKAKLLTNKGVKMNNKLRKVKRYSNRKLYDTSSSSYVNLDGLAGYIQDGEDVVVVENESEKDITAETLTQLILQRQKRGTTPLSVDMLKSVIMQLPKVQTRPKQEKVDRSAQATAEAEDASVEEVVVGGTFWSE